MFPIKFYAFPKVSENALFIKYHDRLYAVAFLKQQGNDHSYSYLRPLLLYTTINRYDHYWSTIVGRYSMTAGIGFYDHKYPSCPMTDYTMHTGIYANLARFLH